MRFSLFSENCDYCDFLVISQAIRSLVMIDYILSILELIQLMVDNNIESHVYNESLRLMIMMIGEISLMNMVLPHDTRKRKS